MSENGIPRRIRLDRMTPAELAITEAMRAVEAAGGSPALTDAVSLLAAARDRVADHADGVRPEHDIPIGRGTIGWAVSQMWNGMKVRRRGWNGKGMFIVLMPELKLPPFNSQTPGARVNDRTAKHIGPDTPLESQPYIAMWTAAGKWQPGWLCSQADLLAWDWELAE